MSAPRLIATAATLLLSAGLLAPLARAQDAARGKAVFDLWCAACHKPVKAGELQVAGTGSLERNYRGTKPAALEERDDLTAAYVKLIVRNGVRSMPFSRQTEISDADLEALSAYLAKAR